MPFEKGQPNPGKGWPKGKPNPKREKPASLLQAMRKVSESPAEEDGTELERLCRTLRVENPKEFLTQLARLESAHRGREVLSSSPGNSEAGIPEKPDERERFLDELTQRLLREAAE